MQHMQLENRQRLGFLASLGWTMRRISEDMGWSAQTIANELLNRRVDSDKRHGCSNRLCAHYEECMLESYSATGARRSTTARCARSSTSARPPRPTTRGTLRNSRTGIHPDEKKVKAMNDVISPALKKGQSATAVVRSNPEAFKGVARSTLYGYIRDGLFTAKGSDMPFAGRSRKPHIERFHNELRRILQKGTSFDPLTQEQICLALSHLNSYPRESLGGRTPYDVFVEKPGAEGKAFLDALGIVRIPSNQVTLHPFLLGQKYQRAADRAILKKNGVIAKKSVSDK